MAQNFREAITKKWTILYVEDEPDIIEALIPVLNKEGIFVVQAESVASAIHKSENQEFDALIFDIHLKSGTGDNAIELIRRSVRNPNMKKPILVASSHIDNPLIHKLADHIQGALVKPFRAKDLIKKLKEQLGK